MKAKKQARGAWRDPSTIHLVKRNALDQLQSTTEMFEQRWGFEKLRALDEDLYEALADQRDMLQEACGEMGQLAECIEHRDAMQRGWARANQVMEEAQVGSVVAQFPGARVVWVRAKEDNPFAATAEPRFLLGMPNDAALPAVGRPEDDPTEPDPEDDGEAGQIAGC